jgi:hypothetical protein
MVAGFTQLSGLTITIPHSAAAKCRGERKAKAFLQWTVTGRRKGRAAGSSYAWVAKVAFPPLQGVGSHYRIVVQKIEYLPLGNGRRAIALEARAAAHGDYHFEIRNWIINILQRIKRSYCPPGLHRNYDGNLPLYHAIPQGI